MMARLLLAGTALGTLSTLKCVAHYSLWIYMQVQCTTGTGRLLVGMGTGLGVVQVQVLLLLSYRCCCICDQEEFSSLDTPTHVVDNILNFTIKILKIVDNKLSLSSSLHQSFFRL
jgi:hypothetical protein